MRLIDADNVKKLILEEIEKHFNRWDNTITVAEMETIAIDTIDNAPTVETQIEHFVNCKDCDGYEAGYSAGVHDAKRPQGEWIQYRKGHYTGVKCSLCDTIMDFTTNYCPKCGAKMTEV